MELQSIPDTNVTGKVKERVEKEGLAADWESGVDGVLTVMYSALTKGWNDWFINGVDRMDFDKNVGTVCLQSIKLDYSTDDTFPQVYLTDPRMNTPSPIIDFISEEDINSADVSNDGWKIDEDVLIECVVNTIRETLDVFDTSLFTEREFIVYYTGSVLKTRELADLMADLFGSDLKAGTVRKYNSRAEKKIGRAEATMQAAEVAHRRGIDKAELEARSESFLSDDDKNSIHQLLNQIPAGLARQRVYESWDITPEYQLTIESTQSKSSKDLTFTIFADLDSFEDPVFVDESEVDHDLVKRHGRLSRFSEYSDAHNDTVEDILESLHDAFEGRNYSCSESFMSISALERDDGTGMIVFTMNAGLVI